MIEYKLIMIEQGTINNPIRNDLKLKAIRVIKKLLTQIDFNAEIVPLESAIKLENLLTSLKGTQLSIEESKLVEELVR